MCKLVIIKNKIFSVYSVSAKVKGKSCKCFILHLKILFWVWLCV